MNPLPSSPDLASPAAPSSNIELKARIPSLDDAREVARAVADQRLPDQHQIDTYFHCQSGRLKLREIVGERAELIAYDRPDQKAAKTSQYYLVPIDSPDCLKQALSMTLGLRGVVVKQREIYLHKNVRIHLDHVDELGTFLEFEAVLGSGDDEAKSAELVGELRERFSIEDSDLIDRSYGDMLERTANPRRVDTLRGDAYDR